MNQTGAEQVRWDLDILYSGIEDPTLESDISKLVEMAKNFNATYKGRLDKALGVAIADYSEIAMLKHKIALYLYLKQTENVTDPAVKAKIARTEQKLSQAQGEYLTFFTIELVALNDDILVGLYNSDEVVARHRPWIEHIRLFRPHILSEPVESAITKRDPFAAGAWSEFFDELEADLEFDFRSEKKTLTEMVHILTESQDAQERSEVMSLINSGLRGPFAKYAAQTLYMVTGSSAVERKERSYKHPMEPTNKSNRVPDTVVDALHRVVQDVAGPLAWRYYRLKAAHLGLKILKWSDRNAPMPFTDTTHIPFDEASATVLAAYESFSPTLAELVHGLISARRIDAPAVKGKRNGAFNYSVVLPGNIPVSFTMLNYLGSNGDVMTLAHELGHGVHGLLAGKEQGPLMSHAPTAYCETASVFGEMTTFNFLRKRLAETGDRKSLLALVMGKIEDVINTTVRQIGFSNFERRIHGMDASYRKWYEPEKLSIRQLSEIFLETQQQLYGGSGDVFTFEDTEYLWSYIGHFHRPFYVYGYAFGELLTHSLYARQADLGDRFEPLYLDMLRSGSTRNIVELLKPFGFDPANETFWVNGINVGLGQMVQEAEQLSREIGTIS